MRRYLFSLSLLLIPPLIGQQIPPANQSSGSKKESVVWVHGTVQDTAGHPLAGAVVRVLGTFQGSIRRYQVTAEGTGGPNGSYEVKGGSNLPFFSGTVIASAPGYAPAWAWPTFEQFGDSGAKQTKQVDASPPIQDFVLSGKGGRLSVTVLRDGKAAPGIAVIAYLQNANLTDTWAMPTSSASPIEGVAYPKATTNGDGVADFSLLLPGNYRIVATEPANARSAELDAPFGFRGEMSEATGIQVRFGETTSFQMNLWKQNNQATMKAMKPDGTLLNQNAAMSYGPIDSIQWTTTPQFDSDGFASLGVSQPGLWRIDVMTRDEPIKSYPIAPPYFLASAEIAVSPSMDGAAPPFSTARWVPAGSVRIHVKDANGKPVHVEVGIENAWSQDVDGKETDKNGYAVFEGLHNGEKYFVYLYSSSDTKVQMVDLGKFVLHPAGSDFVYDDTMPVQDPWTKGWSRAREMTSAPAVMQRTFIARTGKETELEMPVVPMTFVYGIAKIPPETMDWRDVVVTVDYAWLRRGVATRYWDADGHYIIGPFPPGEVTFNVIVNPTEIYHPKLTITGKETEPIRFDFDPLEYPKTTVPTNNSEPTAAVVMGMGGISAQAGEPQRLTGQIFQSDGVTPAFGAQALFFPPGIRSPRLLAFADARGKLQPRGLWYTGGVAAGQEAPQTATVIAFLPGACGAVVETLPASSGTPLHLVLPPPNKVTGNVTVGGKQIGQRHGVIHVIAEWQGKSFLQPYLSLDTTADTEGNFVLGGLTVGEYIVQASLDNLWLSQPMAIHVSANPNKSVQLNIPLPGAALHIQLLDSNDKPVSGGNLVVERSGPMARLWPAKWTSDANGIIVVPTLETGLQTIRVDGEGKAVHVRIPSTPAPPVELPIVVRGSGHLPPVIDDPDTAYHPTIP